MLSVPLCEIWRSPVFPNLKISLSNKLTLLWNVVIPETFNCFENNVAPVTVVIPENVERPPTLKLRSTTRSVNLKLSPGVGAPVLPIYL